MSRWPQKEVDVGVLVPLGNLEEAEEVEEGRDEADALREGLNKLNTDQLYRKKFMDEFPRVKQELEERIGKLHTLADKVDKVHRDCTISNVVAASTGTVSGILTILGLALAPVTAGVSLALSATGIGLGAAAAVTGVSTSIVDYSSKLSAKAEASRLTSIDSDKEMLKESLRHNAPHIGMENIGKNLRAIKLGKPKPPLVSPAVGLVTIGTVSVQSIKQVQKSFEGTALAMAKGARVMGAATAGVFLLMDVISLVEESLHLHEGAKAESAEELRQQAQELERMLEELSQTHERLQQGLIPQPPE
ncbi:PREDICTED: apolipoprotein L3-like [Ceratotherium simum simum]|uniref:Apolipoprotein L3-like n=1 Tax=Ceratotherium simum simum TaxID=73337 RepID=A0ABM1C8K6_CERSS|nr:PREDICTED: apolipoprotein L3-like [Ceratotherium simum simum]